MPISFFLSIQFFFFSIYKHDCLFFLSLSFHIINLLPQLQLNKFFLFFLSFLALFYFLKKMKAVIYAGLVTFSLTLIYVIAYSLPMSLFSYHPLLILVALVSITEGITTIQSKKIVSEENKSYHGLLQGIGFTAMTFGFSVIYYNKNLNSKPHFTT